jgi:hypothetical protein
MRAELAVARAAGRTGGMRLREAKAGTVVRSAAGAERARRRVVRLIFVIYLLAIFEGSLRKWVVPQFSQYVFFIRDPVLIVVYALATRHGLWPKGQAFFTVSLWMCGVGVLLGALQGAFGGPSELRLILGIYGWRAYFLYVPLAFLVGAQFRREDVLRLFRLTLVLAIPIAVLVTVQFFAPPGAAVNVGNAEDQALQFRGLAVDGAHTRPMGPFSSGLGQQMFVATACAIVIALFIAPKHLRKSPLPLLLPGAASVVTCAALSGSRGTVLQCGLSVLFALGVGLLGRGGALKGRALAWPLVLCAAAVVLVPLVLPEGLNSFTERWQTADRAESRSFEWGVFGRALYGLIDFVRLVDHVPLLGYGLGYGGNASITLGARIDGLMPGYLAETDFARHMVDLGPVFGIGYIVFRLALAGWLAALVLRATRQAADPVPMMLLSFVGYIVLAGTITGQGAINLYCWLFTGLLIASCQARPTRLRAVPTPAPLRCRRPFPRTGTK